MKQRTAMAMGALAMTLLAGGGVRAETVRLKSGAVITGKVLVVKDEFVALDIGYTVLQIPRDRIEKIEEDGTGAEADPGPLNVRKETLFMTATLKTRTVRDLVDVFGEGVVMVQTPDGTGSGFFINREGHVITNAHVIQGETRISVVIFIKDKGSFTRRTVKDVRIVAVNPTLDLALLAVERPEDVELTPLYFGDRERLSTGEPVFAIGNPYGLERTVSEGIISHVARQLDHMVLLQTTAAINPGNSGGPLLNLHGEVVGVTNMSASHFADGLGFAIPINYVKDFLNYREAYIYDKDNPNSGYNYLEPPNRGEKGAESDDRSAEQE